VGDRQGLTLWSFVGVAVYVSKSRSKGLSLNFYVRLLVLGTLAGDKFIKGLLQLRLCRFLVIRLMLTHDVIQAASAAMDLQ